MNQAAFSASGLSSVWWIALILATVAAAVLLALWSRPALIRNIHFSLIMLRGLGLGLLLLAVLNPSCTRTSPDPLAYRILVLADVSGSMETRDMPAAATRLETLSQWLNPDNPSGYSALRDNGQRTEVQLFSDSLHPWDFQPLQSSRSGQTAIGDALATVATDSARSGLRTVGAVLVLSDGMQHSGTSMLDGARLLAAQGIPVSTIGVGNDTSSGNLQVSFDQQQLRLENDATAAITVRIDNELRSPHSGELQLLRDGTIEAAQRVEVAADSTAQVEFSLPPALPGMATLEARFVADVPVANDSGTTAFAMAETQPPPSLRTLLIASGNGWDGRVWRMLAAADKALILDALQQLDEGRWLKLLQQPAASGTADVERSVIETLPADPAFFMQYDAIIVDYRALANHANQLEDQLYNFVNQRGGGLLLSGSPVAAELPARLLELFPLRNGEPSRTNSAHVLQIEPFPLFADTLGGALFNSPSPTLPQDIPWLVGPRLSRAASVPVRTRSDQPVLAIHTFGAGRSAVLAADFLWRWQLDGDHSLLQSKELASGLISWLAAGRKQRLQAPLNGRVLPMESAVDFDITLLGDDFSPRMDGAVSVRLIAPDGTVSQTQLQPSTESPGLYKLQQSLHQQGGWQADYRAVLPDGSAIERSTRFALNANSPEWQDTGFREQALRDIARLTGGSYQHVTDSFQPQALPVSSNVPIIEQRFHWARTWPVFIAAMMLFILEWWLRRRHGLR